jgi:hypothetical protein
VKLLLLNLSNGSRMKKSGEKEKFVVHAMFVLVVVLGLYFIVTNSPSLTGYAVLDAATAKSKLESALSSSAIFSQVTDASICVVINDPEKPLSLEAVKSSMGWTVSEMKDLCAGYNAEDVIVQFADYDSYSKVVDNPSPRALANAAIARDFEIVPSKYVELGGNIICDATFRVKYCSALNTMGSPDQLIDADMACCFDTLTSAEKKLLETHLQEGNFKDETGILEQPSPGMLGMSITTSIITLGGIVLVILIVVVIVASGHGKAPKAKAPAPMAAAPPVQMMQPAAPSEPPQITDLRNYVVQVLNSGYAPEDVKTHLLEMGWDEATSDRILQEAYQKLQPAN